MGEDYFNKLQQIKSFNKCTGVEIISPTRWKSNFGRWNLFGLPNRLKTFLLKFYNNILGTGSRVIHIDPTKDPSCTFCNLNNNLPAPIESFNHIFYYCPSVQKIIRKFCVKFILSELTAEKFFGGSFDINEKINLPIMLVLDVLRYSIWELKLQKSKLSYHTVELETLYTLETIMSCSNKIKNTILSCPLISADGTGGDGRRQEDQGP